MREKDRRRRGGQKRKEEIKRSKEQDKRFKNKKGEKRGVRMNEIVEGQGIARPTVSSFKKCRHLFHKF